MREVSSRIETARPRAAGAKQIAAAAAAAGFLVAVLLARAGHPGQAASSSHARRSNGSGDIQSSSGLSLGSGSVSASTGQGAFQGQTNVS